jgi:hypothetical protein
MHSHLSRTLAAERSQELRRAADRARLAADHVANNEPVRGRDRIARLRTRVARLTPRFSETGS